MVVERRNVDSVIEQRGEDRIHFFLEQHKVPHHHIRPVRSFGQRNPAPETKWRRRGEALDGHFQIVARNIHFQNSRLEVSLPVEQLQHILIVARHVLCTDASGECAEDTERKADDKCNPADEFHKTSPFFFLLAEIFLDSSFRVWRSGTHDTE